MQRSRILASWTSVWVIPRTRVRPGEAHGYTLLLFIDTVTPRGHFWWYFRPNDLHEDGDQSESKRTCWFLSKARSPSPLKQASVCFRFQSGLVCLHCPFVFLVWTRHRVSRPFVVLKKKKEPAHHTLWDIPMCIRSQEVPNSWLISLGDNNNRTLIWLKAGI